MEIKTATDTPTYLPNDAASCNYAQLIMQTIRQPLMVLDGKLRVVEANTAFFRTFTLRPAEVANRCLHELGDGQRDLPELKESLRRYCAIRRSASKARMDFHGDSGLQKKLLLSARRWTVKNSYCSPSKM